ncbi:hypothetical protein AAAT68_16965 [Lawsonibacter asaccharolyticus]|jgi:hypothetical protein|nr:MAG TPA: RPAP1-like protein [Caudoviricetes sp.]
MKCKFEHDGDCCNCGSQQYMCKCKPKICGSIVPITNADRIRAMSDEEMETELLPLFEELCEDGIPSTDYMRFWLQQPAEEDS